MLMKQLSIFLENKKGTLADLTNILMEHKLDIRAMAVFDTSEFGILRIVVDDPDQALAVLHEEGYVAKMSKIIAIEPDDRPGSLNEIFQLLNQHNINIEYVYSFVMRRRELPYIVIKVDNQQEAVDLLLAAGIQVVNPEEIQPGAQA